MFNKTKEFKEMQKELKLNKIFNDIAKFKTFVDGMFYFYVNDAIGVTHEIIIKCDDVIFRDMKVCDLMNCKRVCYFSHVIYLTEEDYTEKTWSSLSDSGLN